MADMDKETWAPAFTPFGERYDVSQLGRVFDKLKNRMLKQSRGILATREPGYMKVTLFPSGPGSRKTISVHRLVATAFVPGDASLDVNHKDLDKTNNIWTNLEWMTHAENIRHGMANSFTWIDRLRVAGRKRRKPVVAISPDGLDQREYDSIASAGRAFGDARKAANIFHAIQMGNTAYGFTWRYR